MVKDIYIYKSVWDIIIISIVFTDTVESVVLVPVGSLRTNLKASQRQRGNVVLERKAQRKNDKKVAVLCIATLILPVYSKVRIKTIHANLHIFHGIMARGQILVGRL